MDFSDQVQLLQGLLEQYSPSREESGAVAYLVAAMAALGFEAQRDEAGNAVGVLGSGPDTIMLLGHIDTVPGFIPPQIIDGKLYGRGAVDAKGPLATFVAAAAETGPLPGARIVVVGAVEEEAATSKGARHIAATWPRPTWCIIGEPSGWDRITLGYKGRVLVHYTFSRSMSHTAGQERAAAETAVDFWNQVRHYATHYNQDRPGMFDQLDPSLRQIQTSSDGFEEKVEMVIGLRLPTELTVASVEADLDHMAGPARVTFSSEEPAFKAEKNNSLVRAFLGAVRAVGGTPRFTVKSGTADMNIIGPHWGGPIVAYGPGDSTLDHTPQEHLELAEYRKAIEVLAQVLRSL
ncbi:MAG: [LysW]-lysine hydrolase [Chloroflexi bacterium]|nr:[LysW]-lysine hydrolase [Chloroflexota bacterium]